MEKLVAIILMAGLSERFGGPKNKTLCLLKGEPIFTYAIKAFAKERNFDSLVVVVNDTNKTEIESFLKKENIKANVVLGGKTRQESVENALKTLSLNENDIIVIHDGARPLVDSKVIQNVIKEANESGAATTYVTATNTIALKNKSDEVVEFVDRTSVAEIQTPQAFKYGLLKKAHVSSLDLKATDDCSLVLKIGGKVKLVEGGKKLHKITTIEDILYLEGLLN